MSAGRFTELLAGGLLLLGEGIQMYLVFRDIFFLADISIALIVGYPYMGFKFFFHDILIWFGSYPWPGKRGLAPFPVSLFPLQGDSLPER